MTGPVTTEALVGELAKAIHLSLHPGGNFEMARDNQSPGWMAADALAEQIAADFIAPLLAAHQQVTAERDDWHAAADSATALNKEAVAVIARLRAEGEAKDRRIARLEAALAPFAKAGELFGPRLSDDYDQSIYAPAAGPEFALSADHLRAARAATAREGA